MPAEAQVFVDYDNDVGLIAGDVASEDDDDETAGQARARNVPIMANTPHRRSHAPSSCRQQEPRDPDTAERSASAQDQKMWKTWHEQELPKAFSQFIPGRGTGCLVCKPSMMHYTMHSVEQH
jgi:hypothetical protein